MTKSGVGKIVLWVAIAVVAFLMPQILSGNQYWLTVLCLLAINVLLVSSLRSVTLINEISLGQVGFAIIGAFTYATLMMKGGFSFWPAVIVSGLFSAFVALLLAYPFLKVKGIYFSILTLLVAETFRLVAFYWNSLTGGPLGLTGVPGPGTQNLPILGRSTWTGRTTSTTSPWPWFWSPCSSSTTLSAPTSVSSGEPSGTTTLWRER